MSANGNKILISAGEASGDLQGASLVSAMKSLAPELEFCGLGGRQMRDAGVKTFFDIDKLGGMGLTGVLGGFFHHKKIYEKLKSEIASGNYRAAILIHYPMFNLLLAKACKKYRLPAYFFISPQVWASRKGRIRTIRKNIKKMYVIFPFEEELYQKADVPVEYVGHPFIEQVQPTLSRKEAFEQFGLKEGKVTVGLFPGSRKGEVDRMLPTMIQAANRIQAEIPEVQFILPIADTIQPDTIHSQTKECQAPIHTVTGKGYDVMHCCDYAICTSGSVTLEVGITGCPMVIIYRFNPITFWIFRWFVNVKYFGLINIVAGEEVAPELLQYQVTPERVAEEALKVLLNPELKASINARLLKARETLGEPGVAKRLARSLLNEMNIDPSYEEVSI